LQKRDTCPLAQCDKDLSRYRKGCRQLLRVIEKNVGWLPTLPCHISDIMFVAEITKQYTYWLHFFHEKRKKQFIPLPWEVGDFIFKNMNKIEKFVGHFHSLNLKYVEKVKGFDPNGIFVEHLLAVGFNNSVINTIQNEDGDNALGTPARDTDDLETILNTNESYKQR
jgi:hypothetical protein